MFVLHWKPDHFLNNDCSMNNRPFYLIYFSNTYNDFCLPELDSLLTLFGYDSKTVYDALETRSNILLCRKSHNSDSPFLLATFPDDDCVKKVMVYISTHRKVCSRAVLIKSVYKLWCEGNSWEELFQSLSQLPSEFTSPYFAVRFTGSVHQ